MQESHAHLSISSDADLLGGGWGGSFLVLLSFIFFSFFIDANLLDLFLSFCYFQHLAFAQRDTTSGRRRRLLFDESACKLAAVAEVPRKPPYGRSAARVIIEKKKLLTTLFSLTPVD